MQQFITSHCTVNNLTAACNPPARMSLLFVPSTPCTLEFQQRLLIGLLAAVESFNRLLLGESEKVSTCSVHFLLFQASVNARYVADRFHVGQGILPRDCITSVFHNCYDVEPDCTDNALDTLGITMKDACCCRIDSNMPHNVVW